LYSYKGTREYKEHYPMDKKGKMLTVLTPRAKILDPLATVIEGKLFEEDKKWKQRFVTNNVICGSSVENPKTNRRRLIQTNKRCTYACNKSHETRGFTILKPFKKFIDDNRFVGRIRWRGSTIDDCEGGSI